MTIYTKKAPTFDAMLWDGTNTEAFKVWAEQYFRDPGPGHSWSWSLSDYDNGSDPVVTDGFLYASTGQSMGPWNFSFILGWYGITGEMYDGGSSYDEGVGLISPAELSLKFEELV